MLAEFSIYPLQTEHMSKDVAKVIETLESAGVHLSSWPHEYGGRGQLGAGDRGDSPLSPDDGFGPRPGHHDHHH